jgi:GntR family transcriptional regulator/MocR family aminotransferase
LDLLLHLVTEGGPPLYRQVVTQIRAAVVSGRLAPGTRLPSSRDLAAVHGIARNTVVAAYQQLADEGYLVGRDRSGHYVAADLPDAALQAAQRPAGGAVGMPAIRLSRWAAALSDLPAPVPKGTVPYDLRGGFDPTTFPLDEWRRHLAHQMQPESLPPLDYGGAEGDAPLRESIARFAARSRGVVCEPGQVLITSGARQGVDLLIRTLLEPGDAVAVEEPGYPGVRQALEAFGARIVPVPVDAKGMQVERLEGEGDIRLVFVTPSNQMPLGVTLDLGRRLSLLDWARRTGALVVEDDYDGEFRYEGRPLQSLQGLDSGRHVAHVGSFAKSVAPALRLGYLILPPPLVQPVARARWVTDRQAPILPQVALQAFIASGGLERHLRRVRLLFRARRDAFLGALRQHLPGARVGEVRAGMHVCVTLPGVTTPEAEQALVERAFQAGVGLAPARVHYLSEAPAGQFLCYFAHLPEEDLEEGVRRLAGTMAW